MANTVERRVLPSFVGVLSIVAAFLAWLVPVFVLPFANVLPYLQPAPFFQRLIWSALFFVAACALARAAMTTRQWREVRKVAIRGWGDIFGVAVGLLMAIYASASLSANTFGLMVQALPSERFSDELIVTGTQRIGSRHRALEVQLLNRKTGDTYELVLSKRIFGELPVLNVGDDIRVGGLRNSFGSYVLDFTRVRVSQ